MHCSDGGRVVPAARAHLSRGAPLAHLVWYDADWGAAGLDHRYLDELPTEVHCHQRPRICTTDLCAMQIGYLYQWLKLQGLGGQRTCMHTGLGARWTSMWLGRTCRMHKIRATKGFVSLPGTILFLPSIIWSAKGLTGSTADRPCI